MIVFSVIAAIAVALLLVGGVMDIRNRRRDRVADVRTPGLLWWMGTSKAGARQQAKMVTDRINDHR